MPLVPQLLSVIPTEHLLPLLFLVQPIKSFPVTIHLCDTDPTVPTEVNSMETSIVLSYAEE